MSVKMTRGEGVTVFTVKSNSKSVWPPLFQVIGALCYSPVCCSVSENIRRLQSSSQTALGVLQILVGVLNIGLGSVISISRVGSGWLYDRYYFPYWMGALFMAFGILCILSEKFPSPCMVLANGLLSLTGVGFAIAAIVMYAVNMYGISLWWLCRKDDYNYWSLRTTASPSATDEKYLQQCNEAKAIILVVMQAIHSVLIVLSVLQLCLSISSTVLGFKTLRKNAKETSKTIEDQDQYEPLLEEVTTKPTS